MAVRVAAVPSLVAAMEAPATAAPVESWISPVIEPRVLAEKGVACQQKQHRKNAMHGLNSDLRGRAEQGHLRYATVRGGGLPVLFQHVPRGVTLGCRGQYGAVRA
jgi:hypothetical protein